MNSSEAARIYTSTDQTAKNTSDLVTLAHKELTLSAVAQSLNFTSVEASDVMAVEIRIRKTGSPADEGHIARFTSRSGETPTTSHGMYIGNGDLWTITGNYNIQNFKIISADGGFHIVNMIYYGYAV